MTTFKTGNNEEAFLVARIFITEEMLNHLVKPLLDEQNHIDKAAFAIKDNGIRLYMKGKYRVFNFKAFHHIKLDTLEINVEDLTISFAVEEKVFSNWFNNILIGQASRNQSFLARFLGERQGITVTGEVVKVDLKELFQMTPEDVGDKLGTDIISHLVFKPNDTAESSFSIDIGVPASKLAIKLE